AKDTTSIPVLEAFIRRFGDTYYGDLAKVRLAELKQGEAAKQVAEAAKKQAEEDARAEAEAERQRVATQQEKMRKEVEAAKQKQVDAEKVAALLNKASGIEGAEGRKAGQVFRDCPECPEMVVVPAGSFMMGSSASEIAAMVRTYAFKPTEEGPQHRVTIGRP